MDNDEPEDGCPNYYEHDYKLVDEKDGIATYICRRCDAELQEEIE